MGAWGVGIFSNDLAGDVRSEWRAALLAREDPGAASARIVERWAGELVADASETEFWTGLAAAQSETGHLQPGVRDAALRLIAAGGDVELWEEDGPARTRVLDRLAVRLRGPQPPAKALRGPRAGPDPGVEVGDVVRLWSTDRGRSALFAVTGMHARERRRWPELLGLYWDHREPLPTVGELERLPYLASVDLTAFDLDAGLPDYFDGAWPLTVTIMVDRRGDEFGPHLGEVIARGLRREAPEGGGDLGGWESIVAALDGRAFDFYLEASRRRLATYGDDPRAWERIRRHLGS